MMLTNRDRVGQGIDLLTKGLQPFVIQALGDKYGNNWTRNRLGVHPDAYTLLRCTLLR